MVRSLGLLAARSTGPDLQEDSLVATPDGAVAPNFRATAERDD